MNNTFEPRNDQTKLDRLERINSYEHSKWHGGVLWLSTEFYKYTNVFILIFLRFLGMMLLKGVDHAKKKPIYHRAFC